MNAFQMEKFLKSCPQAEHHMIQNFTQAIRDKTHIPENDIDTIEELFDEFIYFLSIQNNCE